MNGDFHTISVPVVEHREEISVSAMEREIFCITQRYFLLAPLGHTEDPQTGAIHPA
jgi:hypothetical protein